MFSYIKQYFEMGLYTIDNLNTFVASGMMTKDQLNELTTGTPA